MVKDVLTRIRSRASSEELLALGTIAVVAVLLRLVGLAQGMRIDERLTYQYFVSQSWTTAVWDYSMVNNHIFHTVLAKVAVTVFGPWLWALRMPALIAGVLVVPASYIAVRSLYGARAALLAAALVATCAETVMFSANARGYSLMTLAFLLLIIVGVRLQRSPSRGLWALFAVVAALGLWTIPAALYPVGAVSIWLGISLLQRRAFGDVRAFLMAMVLAAILTLALYAPVLEHTGLAALTRNEVVAPSPWPVFFADMSWSVGETAWYWDRGLPVVFAVVLGACALIAVMRHKHVSRYRISLPLVCAVWCATLLIASHRAPKVRVWQWAVPLTAGLAGAGLAHLIDRWPRAAAFTARWFPACVAAFTVISAVSLIGAGIV